MDSRPVGILLKQITDKIKVSADASLKSRGLTLSQVRMLRFVSRHPGGVTQKVIENHFQVSHPTVVGIITRMEKNGYLECWPDPEDKRNKMVRLTQKAQPVASEMEQEMAEQEKRLLRGLSEEQIDDLYELLYRIFDNVENANKRNDTA